MNSDAPPRRVPLFLRLTIGSVIAGLVVLAFAGSQSIADTWYRLDANSLVGLQAFVEQKIDPDPEDPTLYFDYVLPVIELPMALGALVLFVLFDALRLLAGSLLVRGVAALRTRKAKAQDPPNEEE